MSGASTFPPIAPSLLPSFQATRGGLRFDEARQRLRAAKPSKRKFPVIETFGPTIQGEGPEAGLPCCFIRFGGCDYHCSWCDSPYAVDPAEVRANAEKLTAEQIIERLPDVPRVILSGGNPALLQLGGLVDLLHAQRRTVSVETQGSRWLPWLGYVDTLIISPKPPSSGMATAKREAETAAFMDHVDDADDVDRRAIKIVVFDETDLEWAKAFHVKHGRPIGVPLYLSAGTPQGLHNDGTLSEVLTRFRWLCERAANDPELAHARVLPQLHVLAWGTARGV